MNQATTTLTRAASIYTASWFEEPVLRFGTNLFFVNQLWFTDIGAFSNGPFWSLGYEFWYYVIFGAMAFTAGHKRIVLLAAAAAIVGPKILLLLPVWLMGVLAYSVSKRCTFKRSTSLFLFIGSILVYVAMRAFELPLRMGWHTAAFLGADVYERSLAESRNFLFSYIAGVLVSANFIGRSGPGCLNNLPPSFKWTPGGLPKVQSCPRRRWSLATNRPTRWATRGAPRISF